MTDALLIIWMRLSRALSWIYSGIKALTSRSESVGSLPTQSTEDTSSSSTSGIVVQTVKPLVVPTKYSSGPELKVSVAASIGPKQIGLLRTGVSIVSSECAGDLHIHVIPVGSLLARWGMIALPVVVHEDSTAEICVPVYNTRSDEVLISEGVVVGHLIFAKREKEFPAGIKISGNLRRNAE